MEERAHGRWVVKADSKGSGLGFQEKRHQHQDGEDAEVSCPLV